MQACFLETGSEKEQRQVQQSTSTFMHHQHSRAGGHRRLLGSPYTLLLSDDGEIAARSHCCSHSTRLPAASAKGTQQLAWELLPGYQGWTIVLN